MQKKKWIVIILIAIVIAACVGIAIMMLRPHEHSFGEWETKTPAACKNAEVEVRKCKCGEEETREGDPATGHTYLSLWAESMLEKPMATMVMTANDIHVTATCGPCGEVVDITDGIEIEDATLVLGENTITVKYEALSTSLKIEAAELDIALDGTVVDDTYIYSSEKDGEYASKKEMGTNMNLYRIYFRVNVGEIINSDLFLKNRDTAKLQLALTITSGSVTDKTTFKLKAYAPAAGVTDVDFSKLTWNSVDNKEGAEGTCSQLHWSNGQELVSSGEGHNVQVDQGVITVTLAYSQIADFVDENGNILIVFATNTDGLKVGSLENKTETNRPAVKILLNDLHFHVFDQEVAEKNYFVSAKCKEKAQYLLSCSCGEAGTETFAYGSVINHVFGSLVPQKDKTCTENGMKAHYRCRLCGKYFIEKNGKKTAVSVDSLKISAGHDYKLIPPQDPTCTKNGNNKYYKCSICEKYFDADKNETTKDAQMIPALGHTYTSITAVSNLVNPVPNTVVKVSDLSVTAHCEICSKDIPVTDGVEMADVTLVLGENTVAVTYREFSTTVTIVATEQSIVLNGIITDDTYVDSSNKEKDFTAKEALNTNSSSFRTYLRFNVSEILANEQFQANRDNAKVQIVLTIAGGSIADSTTYTLKAYTPAAGVTDTDFSLINWNSVKTDGTYGQLNWGNGTVLSPNVSLDGGTITLTLDYSAISEYVDSSGNLLFAFGTNTSGLKVASMENTSGGAPVFQVILSES